MSGPKPRALEERFAEKVAYAGPNDCWLWTGQRRQNGYGTITVGSRSDGSRRKVVASRLSYELHVGPIPDGYEVCHRCDNPPCVNPAHLFAGTTKDNMQDALAKGRLRQPDETKTHCKYGHELTAENVYRQGRCRYCRECQRNRGRAYEARNRERINAQKRAAYAADPQTHRERSLEHYRAHREERLPKMRAYYRENRTSN